MVRKRIRDTAYVLHMLAAPVVGVLPVLELLQRTGLLKHDYVQAVGMLLVLGFGIPALFLLGLAVLLSFLVRPPDLALWLIAGLLMIACIMLMLEIAEAAIGFVLLMYVAAALGFGIRWMVKAGAWPPGA